VIAIFAREPIPGRAKTRLARAIGGARAAALYAAFVRDTVARCRAIDAIEIHVADPDAPSPFLASLAAPLVPQRGADLGARMAHALARADLVVGTDAPTLPAATLREARGLLASHDVVLSPAADGGFVLIGARGGASFLRESPIRWSSERTLADTIRAARRAHRTIALTAPHHDVDTADDLRLLRAQLALDPLAAPHTASAIGEQARENP
jgi:rSAM/selenodomain-associated transferase 1